MGNDNVKRRNKNAKSIEDLLLATDMENKIVFVDVRYSVAR